MKKQYLFFLISIFFNLNLFSQLLSLPPRSATALTGSQFVTTISSGTLSLTSRENMIFTEISNGNIPDFYRNLVPVTSYATISGSPDSITYYVLPDYLAVGCDTNYFLCPMSPMLATQIADLTGCTLPTRKMVNDIWTAATVKLAPSPIPPGPLMSTVPVFNDHNTTVKGQRDAVLGTHPLGNLVSGDKKDVVISNMIYTTPNRVIIYGWIQLSGVPIQPMTNVHADTYMDYSHGIRLIQNAVTYHGSPNTIKNILQSSTSNPLLSDEGVIATPQYPYSTIVTALNKPTSFAVTRLSPTSIKILVENDIDVTHYKVYTSTDGITYGAATTLVKSSLLLSGLTTNQIYFVKMEAYNMTYGVTSAISEVLAATTSVNSDSVLIVNGFDRAIAGNTYNFVIQHGPAIWNKQKGFSSATNEALTSGVIDIRNYFATDYILGEESTVDETFSDSEQAIMKQYLQGGGELFVSGSEIGWDLDHLGSTTDKDFYNNYLKAFYLFDAPDGGLPNSCYLSKATGSFYSPDSANFDDGTHGTYNVSYPDVIAPQTGAITDFTYCSSTDIGALHYSGMFPSGTAPGKLVHWAFPFEAVYTVAERNNLMSTIIDFFFPNTFTTGITEETVSDYKVYPNPSEGIFNIEIPESEINKPLTVMDLTGRVVLSKKTGNSFENINLSDLSAGIYILTIDHLSKKIVVEKK